MLTLYKTLFYFLNYLEFFFRILFFILVIPSVCIDWLVGLVCIQKEKFRTKANLIHWYNRGLKAGGEGNQEEYDKLREEVVTGFNARRDFWRAFKNGWEKGSSQRTK